eukprot:2612573-Amphidinium_carterae.2
MSKLLRGKGRSSQSKAVLREREALLAERTEMRDCNSIQSFGYLARCVPPARDDGHQVSSRCVGLMDKMEILQTLLRNAVDDALCHLQR